MSQSDSMRLCVCVLLALTDLGFGQSQMRLVQQIEPRGGQRGTRVELTLTGVRAGDLRRASFLPPGLEGSGFAADGS